MTQPLIIPKYAKIIDIKGAVGKIETIAITPENVDIIQGVAIIFHPDPLGGGTFTNKVVQSISKVTYLNGYVTLCPNLRGVGNSEGIFSVEGAMDDANRVYKYAIENYYHKTIIIGGFSFGGYIANMLSLNVTYDKLLLLAPAIHKYEINIKDTSRTLAVFADEDELIDLNLTLAWAKKNDQIIEIIPNCSHFFHNKLVLIQSIINYFIINAKNNLTGSS